MEHEQGRLAPLATQTGLTTNGHGSEDNLTSKPPQQHGTWTRWRNNTVKSSVSSEWCEWAALPKILNEFKYNCVASESTCVVLYLTRNELSYVNTMYRVSTTNTPVVAVECNHGTRRRTLYAVKYLHTPESTTSEPQTLELPERVEQGLVDTPITSTVWRQTKIVSAHLIQNTQTDLTVVLPNSKYTDIRKYLIISDF